MGNSLDINLIGGDCNDSRKSIDINMQGGNECSGGGSIDFNFGGGGLSCYPPCAHTHPIDSPTWGITVLDGAAWLGKAPLWNGTQFEPVSVAGGGVTSFNSRVGAVVPQIGDYNTDIVSEGASNLYWTNSRTIGSTLTGYVSGAGTITSADSVLSAIQKLDGNISGLVTGVSSVFGRVGNVTAQNGDYNTDLVPEGVSNLYWTNARTIGSTLTGYVSGAGTITSADSVLSAIQKLDGNISGLSSVYVPYTGATGDVDLGTNDLNAEGLKVTGVNGNGHLTLRWQSLDPVAAGNHTTFFANSSGDLKYKIDGNYYTTFVTSANTANQSYTLPNASGLIPLGTGASNEIAYWTSTNTLSSLNVSTYPNLTELSYVKGVTSAIQTQLNSKQGTVTIGTIDSQAKVANGLVLTSNVLYAQTADASNVGMVSTGTQTFAGAKTFSNAAVSSFIVTSSNYTAGSSSHLTISPNITANANSVTINAFNINPTLSAGAFTGVTLVDLALTRNNPNINIVSGNLAFMAAQTTQMVIRSASGGVTMLKSKIGSVTGAATNVLDVGGDSLFSLGASTPATASARVHIVGSSASSGTALLVTNSTPTTILKVDNNQDLYLGSSGGKVGMFGTAPIVKVTTAIAGATRVGGGGTTVTTTDTFGGYTIAQVVQALVNYGWI